MKILLAGMSNPKIMILIEEKYINMDNIDMRIAETELYSLLSAKGFDLLDKAHLEKIRFREQSKKAANGNAIFCFEIFCFSSKGLAIKSFSNQ